jgi:DNA-binding GntR family transcriptional regulator
MASEPGGLAVDVAVSQLRIHRSSTAEQAADALRNLILDGTISSGEPLREVRLAQAIGVSRNTMREGIITQDRHHVATVAEIHVDDVGQIFAVRRLLEIGAIKLVSEFDTAPDLRPLRLACDRLRRFRAEEPWLSVIEADRDFHVGLVGLAGNSRLEAVYGRLESEIRMCLAFTTRLNVSLEQIAAEHEGILAHLDSGDYDRAMAYLGETMDLAYARVSEVLERSRSSGDHLTD